MRSLIGTKSAVYYIQSLEGALGMKKVFLCVPLLLGACAHFNYDDSRPLFDIREKCSTTGGGRCPVGFRFYLWSGEVRPKDPDYRELVREFEDLEKATP